MRTLSLILLCSGIYFVGSAIRLATIPAQPRGEFGVPSPLRWEGERVIFESHLTEEEKKKIFAVLDTALSQGEDGFRHLDRAIIELGFAGLCCLLGSVTVLSAAKKMPIQQPQQQRPCSHLIR